MQCMRVLGDQPRPALEHVTHGFDDHGGVVDRQLEHLAHRHTEELRKAAG